MTTRTTFQELGFSPADVVNLAIEVARHAGYQLAGHERGEDWNNIAKRENVKQAIGSERWARLAKFTFDAIDDLTLQGETDESGPVVRMAEFNRLGAIVLAQFLAQETPAT